MPAPSRTLAAFAPVKPGVDPWHVLLDLTSEVLELFVIHGNAEGAGGCIDFLDLLAQAFAVDCPDTA